MSEDFTSADFHELTREVRRLRLGINPHNTSSQAPDSTIVEELSVTNDHLDKIVILLGNIADALTQSK